jgi:hypothetical protein
VSPHGASTAAASLFGLRFLPPALAVLLIFFPTAAKLLSTKDQEFRMIGIAVPASEKWLRHFNESYKKNNAYDKEIDDIANDAGGLAGGIFNDMYIVKDVARLCVYAKNEDVRLLRGFDDFDKAAERLCAEDRMRYYSAKAKLCPQMVSETAADGLKKVWLGQLTQDCLAAAKNGHPAEKSIDMVRQFVEKHGLKAVVLDETVCRAYQNYARYFLTKAKELHAKRLDKEAFESAADALKEIPWPRNLAFDACGTIKSDDELLSAYDRNFLKPLSSLCGNYADEFEIAACDRLWDQKKLVSLLLPRITRPSSDAFSLFEKAGNDDVLKSDVRIARAELALWKKAKKTREFKKEFPERYRLATRPQ